MNNENHIKKIASTIFGQDPAEVTIIRRLMGGMSNYTYVISVSGEKYTFRIPGRNAEKFVDRDIEQYHLELINPLMINNETVHIDTKSGVKIARYVEGVPLHEKRPYDYLEEAAGILRKIHTSGIKSDFDYAPFERLKTYEDHVKAHGHSHDARYEALKARLTAHRDFLDRFGKTLTHGDAQISNFVVTEDGLQLMDWEFTGNNDPYYDIACFGNNDFDHAVALLPVYLARAPKNEDYKRLYLWRAFQCLQWHNVALYKHFIGLSENLKIDFDKISELYLDKAKAMLDKVK